MSRLNYIYEWLDTPSRSPRRGLLVFEDEIRALLAVAEAAKVVCLDSAHDAAIGSLKPELAGRLNDLREALSKLEEAAT